MWAPTNWQQLKAARHASYPSVHSLPPLGTLTIWICKCATNEHFKMSPTNSSPLCSQWQLRPKKKYGKPNQTKAKQKTKSSPARAQSAVSRYASKWDAASVSRSRDPSRVLQLPLVFYAPYKKRCSFLSSSALGSQLSALDALVPGRRRLCSCCHPVVAAVAFPIIFGQLLSHLICRCRCLPFFIGKSPF